MPDQELPSEAVEAVRGMYPPRSSRFQSPMPRPEELLTAALSASSRLICFSDELLTEVRTLAAEWGSDELAALVGEDQ